MAWISATTLEGKNANLHSAQIAAILDRVRGEVLFEGPPAELKGCRRSITARHI